MREALHVGLAGERDRGGLRGGSAGRGRTGGRRSRRIGGGGLLRGVLARLLRWVLARLLRILAGLRGILPRLLRVLAGLRGILPRLLLVLARLLRRRLLLILAAGRDPTGTEHTDHGGPKHDHSHVRHTSPG